MISSSVVKVMRRTSWKWDSGVTRSFLASVARWAPGRGIKVSVGGNPRPVCFSISTSLNSRIYSLDKGTSSGIFSIPSGNGHFSSTLSNNLLDHGINPPSIPSACCSSPSPRSHTSLAPSCKTRLCSFFTAQLNLRYVLSPSPKLEN